MTGPLTGLELASDRKFNGGVWEYDEPPLGRWALQHSLDGHGFGVGEELSLEGFHLNIVQTRQLLALASSRVREASFAGLKPPIFMSEFVRNQLQESGQIQNSLHLGWRVCPIEDMWREVSKLTLDDKAVRTLANLHRLEGDVGIGVRLSFNFGQFPGVVGPETEDSRSPLGIVYGAVKTEIPVVLQLLLKRDLIQGQVFKSVNSIVHITPEGYAELARFMAGDVALVRRAFMICRFIPEMDAMYDGYFKPAGDHADVNCPIHRVKDVHHVDRIDDKIVRMIEESTIVVVDLTEDNFNVAFEAGYALALDRPIVWTKKDDGTELRLPFDIQSHNILPWHPDRLEEFAEALRYRMLAALDKAANKPGVRRWA